MKRITVVVNAGGTRFGEHQRASQRGGVYRPSPGEGRPRQTYPRLSKADDKATAADLVDFILNGEGKVNGAEGKRPGDAAWGTITVQAPVDRTEFMTTRCGSRRRGTVYVLVLGCAMLMAVGRRFRTDVRTGHAACHRNNQAHSPTRACMPNPHSRLGMFIVKSDPDWRTDYATNLWLGDIPMGNGTFSLYGPRPPMTATWPTTRTTPSG